MVVQWVVMLVILQILVLECTTSILLYQDYKPIGNMKWDFLYKFFIGLRVYLTMIVQYKSQHDDEMTSKDDKSIGLICYTCIG